jgi:hypothetical protein
MRGISNKIVSFNGIFYLFVVLQCIAGHYEWHIGFPQPDVNLGAVRARVGEDGILIIEVPRRPHWQASRTACLATLA